MPDNSNRCWIWALHDIRSVLNFFGKDEKMKEEYLNSETVTISLARYEELKNKIHNLEEEKNRDRLTRIAVEQYIYENKLALWMTAEKVEIITKEEADNRIQNQ